MRKLNFPIFHYRLPEHIFFFNFSHLTAILQFQWIEYSEKKKNEPIKDK